MTLPVLFGANIDPTWQDPHQPRHLARSADESGLDLVTVQDHPYQRAFYDTWTLISYLAATTQRVTIVPTVANLPLRPPAVLAKSAASLDILSGGRVQLGLGAGAFWDAIAAMGGPRRDKKEAVDALDEAIEVIRLMWSGQRSVRFDGSHYRLSGVHPGPAPSPALGIWLGAYGPRTIRLTGTKADGWMPSLGFLGLDRLGEAVARLHAAAEQAGRDPHALRKVYNLNGIIGSESPEPFQGSIRQWTDQLVDVVQRFGMNAFVYWPNDDHARQLRIFAEQVVPEVRQAITG
ncbi:LLM class flavin-dependent oxidoreductase [Saccharopolyspora sp. K220]|uniref:LLM class flavin-dependent oxidoreductase n=1 Tax=Saccharopolyspora soli TaxID=2926618 RepID=UPI001F5A9D90|nr:LLM class flavin-dependent oxidoreductase [Saccharopolyspora soli]MCI2419558.1 LLM class flavin-dependent oxidoreductase [Saccharopolyspora soli]